MNETAPPKVPNPGNDVKPEQRRAFAHWSIRDWNLGNSGLFPAPRRFRRQVRTSYTVVLILFLLTFYVGVANLAFGGTTAALASVVTMALFALAGWLHHRGRHTMARILLLTTANFSTFVLSFLLDPNSNVSLVLLTYVGLPFIVMSWRENRLAMALLCLMPLAMWILLMVSNYGNGAFVEVDKEVSAIFGYSHSIMVFLLVAVEFAYYDWVTQNYSRAMQRSLRAEERANRAKTAFLRSMSHEMRTPLNAVLGAADLLADHPKASPDIKRLARVIENAGTDILALTEKSMAYARIASGSLNIDTHAEDPLGLIEPVIERFRGQIEDKDIGLEISKTNHRKVLVDPAMFTEALTQIIDNAVTYTPSHGMVRLSIEDGSCNMVRIVVSDTGPGIPKARRHEVFKPYERLEQTYGTNSGSGVGLTIAKAYLTAMAGQVGLDHECEQGARIWVEVPVAG